MPLLLLLFIILLTLANPLPPVLGLLRWLSGNKCSLNNRLCKFAVAIVEILGLGPGLLARDQHGT